MFSLNAIQMGDFNTVSIQTNATYKATTVNGIMATVCHVGRWLHKQRPLLAGDSFNLIINT